MNKYKIFIFVALILSWARIVSADFIITEVMYDPSGADQKREWIEVQNTGPSAEDLSKWSFVSDDSKHALTPASGAILAPGTYAVIAQDTSKFKKDWANYNGLIFDSSWTSFNNKGETIALKDPLGNIKSTISFSNALGADGNGDSLQLIGSVWQGAHPTPGAENKSNPAIAQKAEMPAPAKLIVTNTQSQVTVSSAKPLKEISNTTFKDTKPSYNPPKTNSTIDLNKLGANVNGSSIARFTPMIAWAGLAAIIVAGITLFLYTKRKIRGNAELSGDFSADDFTIQK